MQFGLRNHGYYRSLLWLFFTLLSVISYAEDNLDKLPTIEFEGKHGGHLQGIATDGKAISGRTPYNSSVPQPAVKRRIAST